MKLGWIGLGAMGGPMAEVAAGAGLAPVAYDVAPGRAGEGVEEAGSPAEAARDADLLVLMVATAEQVESVLDEALDALAPEAVAVVMATVGPAAVQRWAERVALVDAPVSGGVKRAGEGDLVAFVSGAPTAVERATPLLDALASTHTNVGDEPGEGQKVKLVNQLLAGVHIAAAAEALAFAEALGLEAATARELVRGGAAASFMLDDRGQRMVDGAFEDPKSALDIFVKDMGLVCDAARERTYPTPLASVAEQLYRSGSRAGLGRLDDSVVIEVLRGRAGGTQDGDGD
jgi:3-hydroxyisobutyrate dehydrogenase